MSHAPVVGVLALQGAVREHVAALEPLGATTRLVKLPAHLDDVDALVLPGGESTAMARLARPSGLLQQVRSRIDAGMPCLGTCAGLILLADRVADAEALTGLPTIGGLAVTVRRNAYGAQLASGEADVDLGDGTRMRGVFIRAPRIEAVGAEVEVVGRWGHEPVVVRQGGVIGATFHPELSGDTRLHRLLLEGIGQRAPGPGSGDVPVSEEAEEPALLRRC